MNYVYVFTKTKTASSLANVISFSLYLLSGVEALGNSVGNDVHFLSAVGGDNSGEFLLSRLFILLNDAEVFEIVEGVSDDSSSSGVVVSSLDSVSLVRSVEVLQRSNTDVSSQVNFSGDGS